MYYPKWLSLLAMGAAAGGMLLFGGVTASAETALPEALQTAETASAVVATATGPEFQPQTETPEITGGRLPEVSVQRRFVCRTCHRSGRRAVLVRFQRYTADRLAENRRNVALLRQRDL